MNEEVRPLALITGASSDVGYELARTFVEHGYDLVIVAGNRSRLSEAAAALSEMDEEPSIEVIQADLSDAEGVLRVYRAIKALDRPIDLLAANAGAGVSGDFVSGTNLDAEIAFINLNVTSQVHLIKLIAFEMVNRGSGDILITSSIEGMVPAALHAASIAFLQSFGQAIRHELKDTGVTVTVLMPDPADMEVLKRADMLDTRFGQPSRQNPAAVAEAAFDALRSTCSHPDVRASASLRCISPQIARLEQLS